MKRILIAFLVMIGGIGAAQAQCASGLIANCQNAVNPQTTDSVYLWQYGQIPNSRKISLGSMFSAAVTPTFAAPPPMGNVTPNTGVFTTLGAKGTTTLLLNTGRDLTIRDGTTRVEFAAANSNPIWFRSPFELASTVAPQNKTEFTLLGFSGNAITLSGSQTYELMGGNATLNGTSSADQNFYHLSAQSGINSSSAPNGVYNFTSHLGIVSGAGGGHTAILADVIIPAGQTGLTNMNPTAGQFQTTVYSNAGGISGTTSGNAYGGYFQVGLNTGATFWRNAVGMEIDVGVQTGASLDTKTGLQVVTLPSDAVSGGLGHDTAYVIGQGASAAVGWDYGFRVNGVGGGFPIKPTGSIFGVPVTAFINGGTIANGFDLTNLTITGNAWKSTGFAVDGSGNVTGASYKVASTAGVTCSGTPTSSFASIGGIVTHC